MITLKNLKFTGQSNDTLLKLNIRKGKGKGAIRDIRAKITGVHLEHASRIKRFFLWSKYLPGNIVFKPSPIVMYN